MKKMSANKAPTTSVQFIQVAARQKHFLRLCASALVFIHVCGGFMTPAHHLASFLFISLGATQLLLLWLVLATEFNSVSNKQVIHDSRPTHL